jgi:hypothetical protein
MRVRIGRKGIGVAAGVTLLMAGIVGGAVASSSSGDASGARHASHWAFQPVGSWVWTTDLGPVGSVPVLVTFHRDGTIANSDSLMFANPLAPPAGQGAKRSPHHGVWQRTGGHTFGGTSLWFQFNSAGLVVGYQRSRSALELVDADHLQGVMFLDSLAGCNANPALPPIGCPDPTDPDAVWTPSPLMPPGGFPVSATRIHRLPLPE